MLTPHLGSQFFSEVGCSCPTSHFEELSGDRSSHGLKPAWHRVQELSPSTWRKGEQQIGSDDSGCDTCFWNMTESFVSLSRILLICGD